MVFQIRMYDEPEAVGLIVSPAVAEDIADALAAMGDPGTLALSQEIRYRLKLRPSGGELPTVDPAAGRFISGKPAAGPIPAAPHGPGERLPVLLTEGGFTWAAVRAGGDCWLYGEPGIEPTVAADLAILARALNERRISLDAIARDGHDD